MCVLILLEMCRALQDRIATVEAARALANLVEPEAPDGNDLSVAQAALQAQVRPSAFLRAVCSMRQYADCMRTVCGQVKQAALQAEAAYIVAAVSNRRYDIRRRVTAATIYDF
jgi:hypothetical protein